MGFYDTLPKGGILFAEGLDNFRVDFLAAELVFYQRYFPLGDEI